MAQPTQPTLLYGCESWTTYQCHIRCLDQFYLRECRSFWL